MGSLIPNKSHSRVGPSSYARAEACTASAILAAAIEPESSSPFAAEGTAAHQVFEECLTNDEDPVEHVGRVFLVDEHEIEFTLDMAEALGPSVAWVKALPSERRDCEVRMNLPRTEMYGYADVISHEDILHVVDLKFGAGITVEPTSVQLHIYGLMALLETYGMKVLEQGDGREAILKTTILQPRSSGNTYDDCMSSTYWTRDETIDLLARVFETLDAISAGVIRYASGDHCQFCRVVPTCPYLRQQVQDAVMSELFQSPEVLETLQFKKEVLEDTLDMVKSHDLWLRRVEELARLYLENGGTLRNRKLVDKRPVRSWIDEGKAQAYLEDAGVDPFQPPKLLSPPMAEKRITKNKHAEMSKLVQKKSSGLTVAPMEDKRPSVQQKAAMIKAASASESAQRRIQSRKK